jgi:Ni/Co efflux regulator RcnB
MRKILLSLAALAALGIALPAATSTADAREVVIIKKKHRHHWDRGHHHGWYRHNHWRHREHHGWRHHHDHGARVVIR